MNLHLSWAEFRWWRVHKRGVQLYFLPSLLHFLIPLFLYSFPHFTTRKGHQSNQKMSLDRFLGAKKHLFKWLSIGWLVCRVTHSFDDPHVAPYWPTWPCLLVFASDGLIKNSRKSVRWSAVPVSCLSRLCLKLRGSRAAAPTRSMPCAFTRMGNFFLFLLLQEAGIWTLGLWTFGPKAGIQIST